MTAETDAAGMSGKLDALIEALLNQGQFDEDGVMCIVSRQACDDAVAFLREAARRLQGEGDAGAAVAELRKGCRCLYIAVDASVADSMTKLAEDVIALIPRPAAEVRERVARLLNHWRYGPSDDLTADQAADAILALLAQPDARKAALEEVAQECDAMKAAAKSGGHRNVHAYEHIAAHCRRLQQRPERE